MGGGTSKLDHEEQLPAPLRPFRRRIEEIMQRRRVRHGSIVSTTELLRPEDCEGVNDNSIEKTSENIVMVVVEEKERENTRGVMIKREDEELPRSPSFRIYFTEKAMERDSDNDPIKVIEKIKEERLSQEKERTQEAKEVKAHGREQSNDPLISNEDSTDKPHKKEKGRRFKALTKTPSRLYNFLSSKNCYDPNNTTDMTANDSPRQCHDVDKSA